MSDSASRLQVAVDGPVLTVVGDLDAHSCKALADGLDPLPGDGDVHIDMAGVGFMDSSGLRVLIAAHQSGQQAERSVKIVNPSPAVHRVIEISGLTDHLHVVAG